MTGNEDKTITSKDSFEFRRRVNLVRHSIYGVFLSSKNQEFVSIYQILNRILILLQQPVTFVFYEKIENKYKRINHEFMSDPFYRNDLYNNKTKELKIKGEKITCAPEEITIGGSLKGKSNCFYCLFRVFDTEYYLMVFRVVKKTNNLKKSNDKYTEFQAILDEGDESITNTNSYIRWCMKEILSLKDFFHDNFKKSFKVAVEKTIKQLYSENTPSSKSNNQKIEYDKDSVKDIEKRLGNIFSAYTKIGYATRLINSVPPEGNMNSETGVSPVETQQEVNESFSQPNIILFTRSFSVEADKSGKKWRRDGLYDYDVRLCIYSSESDENTQEDDIKTIFKTMSEIGMDAVHNQYKCEKYINRFEDENSRVDGEKVFDEFLKILSQNSEASNKKILEILKSPLGKNARSFSDPVFCSGLIHFRYPFARGGLERIDGKLFDENGEWIEENKNDWLRVVIAHYYFEAIAPYHEIKQKDENKNEQLALILIPVEVGSSTWGVLGHIVKTSAKDNDEIASGSEEWDAIYNFYEHIFQRVQRDLRQDLLKEYLDVRFRYLKDRVIWEILFQCESHIDAQRVLKADFKNNKYLERYFPFSKVELSINKKQWDMLPDVLNLNIKIHSNDFFPEQRARDRNFLDSYLEKEVTKYVGSICREAINDMLQVAISELQRSESNQSR